MNRDKTRLDALFTTCIFLMTILGAIVPNLARADLPVVEKVFDGRAVSCPLENFERGPRAKALRAEIDGTDLVLSMNICVNGVWKLDPSLASEVFSSLDGHAIQATYSNFKVLVQTTNWTQAKTIDAKDIVTNSQFRIALTDLRIDTHAAVDVTLQAHSAYTLKNGTTLTDSVSWGEFRVRF